jgi:hypothetical protein
MALNTVLTQNEGNIGGGTSGNSNIGNGDFATPADVPDGIITFFPLSGSSIDLTSNSLSDFNQVQAVLGTPDGRAPRRTQAFRPSETRVQALAHQSEQAQQTEVTPETVSEETYVGLKIISIEEGNQPRPMRVADFFAQAGHSQQDIAQEFADIINGWEDPINAGAHGVTGDMDVTASADSGTLTITAENAGDIFDVAVVGDHNPSITQAQDPKPGSGTGEQVIEMEESVRGILGRTQVENGLLGEQDDVRIFAEAGLDYDLVTLRIETDYDESINPANRFQDVKLALETSIDKSAINNFLGISL